MAEVVVLEGEDAGPVEDRGALVDDVEGAETGADGVPQICRRGGVAVGARLSLGPMCRALCTWPNS